uniref:UDENN domain-containing protein n=2 Tax=Mesocestoides corti TaxID=53468 RepID=A0A5K3EUF0_MESCO
CRNTYVPILPKGLIDYLSAPTPFLYGIHASYCHLLPDIPDVFIADLDVGRVICPENLPLPQIPQPFLTEAIQSLFHILSPDLLTADNVYPPPSESVPQLTPIQVDKRLRAVFLRLFASVFAGYRSCLTITRIHPQPVIHFNQSLFLVLRGVHEPDDFFDRILSSMRFHQFVLERGPPFRVCDLFDEEYDLARAEAQRLVPQFIAETAFPDMDYAAFISDFEAALARIAQKFMDNEDDEAHPIADIIQEEAVDAHNRLHHRSFPRLNSQKVDEFAQKAQELINQSAPITAEVKETPRFVPKGEQLDLHAFKSELPADKCRVIREFVADVFDLHITEALKRRNTIRQDLKSQPFRRLFVDELHKRIIPPSVTSTNPNSTHPENTIVEFERRASLSWEQFDVIVGLLDEALRYEGMSYNTVIAPPVMDLATRISTQLGGIRYFANMTHHIQRHRIWSEMSFWEDVFNEQVNNQIKQLYLHQSEVEHSSSISSANLPPAYSADQSVLEIAAEELRSGCLRSAEAQVNLQRQEEGTVYSQILHFINLIVNFRVPLSAASPLIPAVDQPAVAISTAQPTLLPSNNSQQSLRGLPNGWPSATLTTSNGVHGNISHERRDLSFVSTLSSNHHDRRSISYGGGGSGTGGGGSALVHHYPANPHNGAAPLRDSVAASELALGELAEWIRKFVEKVGTENALPESSIVEIKNKIDSILEGHLLNLADIYPEVKKIPKIKKPEIANPALLSGESIIRLGGLDRLPCQLLVDGRMERAGGGDWRRLEPMSLFDTASGLSALSSASLSHEILNEDVDSVGRTLVPAQGALFVTNYRVIFIGVPKDPFQSNKVVCRSFPVAALHSIKRIGNTRVITVPAASTIAATFDVNGGSGAGSKHLRKQFGSANRGGAIGASSAEILDVYRLRALNMQMLRLGFDPDDVPSEAREELRHLLVELRFHAHIGLSFNTLSPPRTLNQQPTSGVANECRTPLPDIVKQELQNPVILTLQTNEHEDDTSVSLSVASSSRSGRSSRSQSQVTATLHTALTPAPRLRTTSMARLSPSNRLSDTDSIGTPATGLSDDSLRVDEFTDAQSALSMTLESLRLAGMDPIISEALQQSPGYLDLVQIALRTTSWYKHPSSPSPLSSIRSGCVSVSGSQFKPSPVITTANANYAISRTYPSLLIVPSGFKRSQLERVARYHKHGRLPVVVWQHAETRAFLLRGAAFQAKSILSSFKHTVGGGASGAPDRQSLLSTNETEATNAEASSAKEHARYFLSLVNMSPLPPSAILSPSAANSASGSVRGKPAHQAFDEPLSSRINSMMLLPPQSMDQQFPCSPSPTSRGGLLYEKTGSLLRASRTSSGVFGSMASLNKPFDKRLSLFINAEDWKDASPSVIYTSSVDVGSTNPSVTNGLKGLYTPHQSNKSKGHIRGGALGKLSGGKTSTSSHPHSHQDEGSGTISSTQHLHQELRMPTALYVLSERSVKTTMKSGHFPGVEFIPVDYASHSAIRETFKKLYDACLPKDARSRLGGVFKEHYRGGEGGVPGGASDHENNLATAAPNEKSALGGGGGGDTGIRSRSIGGIIAAIAESGWLEQIQSLLQLAGVLVDILGVQGTSVAVCLEDGSDVVTQIVSLAQVMLDPAYRTVAGFWSLVEKEWLLFGHPFNQRVGQKAGGSSGKASHFSPVFLQFLDAVHQLVRQFPLSFEFNDFFLQFLAYHHVSNRFFDFKHDSELQRMGRWSSISSAPGECGGPSPSSSATGGYQTHSIWRFIQEQHEEWPVFFNFYYCPECTQKTLIPATHQAALNVWKYYLSEDLASGPVFDLDLFCPSYRKHTNRPYEPVLRQGYNNSHVEQTYALLGLREGDEAVGWQEAWSEAVRLSTAATDGNEGPLATYTELPLSEEAGADFDRIVRAKLATDAPILSTTLKPPAPPPEQPCASLPTRQSTTFEEDRRSCASDGDTSITSDPDGGDNVMTTWENVSDANECVEAQRAVFAQHRAVTMRRMNRALGKHINNPQYHHIQSSTLAVPASTTDDVYSLSHSVQHSGSLNDLPIAEDNFGELTETALFEQPHNFRRVKTTLSVSRCDACQALILATGITRGLVRCVDCNFCCHEKCALGVPRDCPGVPTHRHGNLAGPSSQAVGSLPGTGATRPWNRQRAKTEDRSGLSDWSSQPESLKHWSSTVNRHVPNGVGSSGTPSPREKDTKAHPSHSLHTTDSDSPQLRPDVPARPSYIGSVAFCGELYKLSSRKLLAGWKPRFFVLDTEHHQMRYYDTAQDEVPRGCIDLQDVRAVRLLRNATSVPRRFQDNCTFEIETPARQFRFAADDSKSAQAWVERIQSTIL